MTNSNIVGPHGSIPHTRGLGVPFSSYLRYSEGSWWNTMHLEADTNHKGQSLHFIPTVHVAGLGTSEYSGGTAPQSMAVSVSEIRWEAFVAAPMDDLEDLARAGTDEQHSKAEIWESPAGFLLSGSWYVDTGVNTCLNFLLSEGAPLALDASMPHVLAVCRFATPISLPAVSGFQVVARIDKLWKPRTAISVRCSMRYTFGNTIEVR